MDGSSQLNEQYQEVKTMPWNLIQIGVALSFIVPLLLKSRRAMAALALEYLQALLLIVFVPFNVGPQGMRSLLMLQFSHFKILDFKILTAVQTGPTWLGYYPDFFNNAYLLLGLIVVLLFPLLFLGVCNCQALKNHLSRLWYRLLLLAFIPLTYYLLRGLRLSSKGEIIAGAILYLIYLLLLGLAVFSYKSIKDKPDTGDGQDSINLLELRSGICRKKAIALLINPLISPVAKLALVLWTAFGNASDGAIQMAVFGVYFLIHLALSLVIRPFERLLHNIYAAVGAGLCMCVSLTALGGTTSTQLANNNNYVVLGFLVVFYVYSLVTILIIPVKPETYQPSNQSGTIMTEPTMTQKPNGPANPGQPNPLLPGNRVQTKPPGTQMQPFPPMNRPQGQPPQFPMNRPQGQPPQFPMNRPQGQPPQFPMNRPPMPPGPRPNNNMAPGGNKGQVIMGGQRPQVSTMALPMGMPTPGLMPRNQNLAPPSQRQLPSQASQNTSARSVGPSLTTSMVVINKPMNPSKPNLNV